MPTTVRPGRVLVAVALPLVVLSLDFSGVAVALPRIGAELHEPDAALSWVINAFALGFAAPLLVVGRVADSLGLRRVLLTGVVVFTAGALLCAVAPTYTLLVAGRLVQGLGTAGFMTASLSVVSTTFTGSRRAVGVGAWSAIGGAASAAAPVVAGVVTQLAGWRWFFALGVPVLALAVPLTLAWVPADDRGTARAAGVRGPRRAELAATAGVAVLVLGLQGAGTRGWGDPAVLGGLLLGLVLLVVAVAGHVVGRDVTSAAGYRVPLAVAFLANWGFGALGFLLTFWIQDVQGRSAAVTGLAFLAYSVPFAALGLVTAPVMSRLGTRTPMAIGMVGVAASFGCLVVLGSGTGGTAGGTAGGMAWALASLGLSGLGQGLAYNVSTTAAMSAVPDRSAGEASGVLTTARNLGVVIGIALATSATAGPGGVGGDGIARAAWVVTVVSLVGAGVAALARTAQPAGTS